MVVCDRALTAPRSERKATWMKPRHSLRNFVGGPGDGFPLSWWIETCRYASWCWVGKRRDRQLMHDRSGWGMKNNASTCRVALWERGRGICGSEKRMVTLIISFRKCLSESKFQINLTSSWQLNDGTGLWFGNRNLGWVLPPTHPCDMFF